MKLKVKSAGELAEQKGGGEGREHEAKASAGMRRSPTQRSGQSDTH